MLARASGAGLGDTEIETSREGFLRGLARADETVPLSHLLFEVRSRQLLDGTPRHEALAFLSGLIVGQDVDGAMKLLRDTLRDTSAVTVIGSSQLAHLYQTALNAQHLDARIIDAGEATVWGLNEIAHAQ
jgi:2-dehydro-3-deoxygalactonokinase